MMKPQLLGVGIKQTKIYNIFLNSNFDISQLETYHGYYGVGFYFFSSIFELPINILLDNFEFLDSSKVLLNKHPSVFLFFLFLVCILKNYLLNY